MSSSSSSSSSKRSAVDPTTAGKYPKAESSSSVRVRAAKKASSISEPSRQAEYRRARKRNRISKDCIAIDLKKCSDRRIDDDVVEQNHLVFDGGDEDNDPVEEPSRQLPKPFVRKPVKALHIFDDHLKDGKGLYALDDVTGNLHFLLAPRESVLRSSSTKSAKTVVKAFDRVASSINLPNPRAKSTSRQVFFDSSSSMKHTVAGVQTSLGSRGVKSHSRQARALSESGDEWAWNVIYKLIKRTETVFNRFCPTEVIFHLNKAKEAVDFKTFPSYDGTKQCKYYAAVAYGKNVYLSMHDDDDFTYSVVIPHMEEVSEKVVLYFCFPTLGIAVPLRPGDMLIFNPQTIHGISSRCRKEDEIYCTSIYLKSKVVSGNDNLLPATEEQIALGCER